MLKFALFTAAAYLSAVAHGSDCWAAPAWNVYECKVCSEPKADQCPEWAYTPCFKDKKTCLSHEPAVTYKPTSPPTCWAATNWSNDGKCAKCPDPVKGQCQSAEYTPCYDTEEECQTNWPVAKTTIAPPPAAEVCYAAQGWYHRSCAKCNVPLNGQCASTEYTPCFASIAECESNPPAMNPEDPTPCFAAAGWSSNECYRCDQVQRKQCVSFDYTPCYPSVQGCLASPPASEVPSSSRKASLESFPESKGAVMKEALMNEAFPESKGAVMKGAVMKGALMNEAFPESKGAVMKGALMNEAFPESKGALMKGRPTAVCFAAESWTSAKCTKCTTGHEEGACKETGYTPCFESVVECERSEPASASALSPYGPLCLNHCPENTLHIQRPTLKGPNCYDSQYGARFGPTWTPSGRTAFEKEFSNPSALYFGALTASGEDAPVLPVTWNLRGCDAAAAMFENIVCALEMYEERAAEKEEHFPGVTEDKVGYTIKDFIGSSDHSFRKLELAAFLGVKMRETARFTSWWAAPWDSMAFSEFFFGDSNVLAQNPELMDSEGPLNFAASIFTWMTPRRFASEAPISGRIRPRDAIIHWKDGKLGEIYGKEDLDKYAGFGLLINVMNGELECTTGHSDDALWTAAYFLQLASRLGLDKLAIDGPCESGAICEGVFRGCKSVAKATCAPEPNFCGSTALDFVLGWTENLCKV